MSKFLGRLFVGSGGAGSGIRRWGGGGKEVRDEWGENTFLSLFGEFSVFQIRKKFRIFPRHQPLFEILFAAHLK